MAHRYQKHYTLEEARALLPQIRLWLKRVVQLRSQLEKHEKKLEALSEPGRDLGGEAVNAWLRTVADIKEAFYEFQRREIQIKDLDRGLIDFPAFVGGKEVFLCWEQGSEAIRRNFR